MQIVAKQQADPLHYTDSTQDFEAPEIRRAKKSCISSAPTNKIYSGTKETGEGGEAMGTAAAAQVHHGWRVKMRAHVDVPVGWA